MSQAGQGLTWLIGNDMGTKKPRGAGTEDLNWDDPSADITWDASDPETWDTIKKSGSYINVGVKRDRHPSP